MKIRNRLTYADLILTTEYQIQNVSNLVRVKKSFIPSKLMLERSWKTGHFGSPFKIFMIFLSSQVIRGCSGKRTPCCGSWRHEFQDYFNKCILMIELRLCVNHRRRKANSKNPIKQKNKTGMKPCVQPPCETKRSVQSH